MVESLLLLELEPEPVKKILGAGQKWTGSATLTLRGLNIFHTGILSCHRSLNRYFFAFSHCHLIVMLKIVASLF